MLPVAIGAHAPRTTSRLEPMVRTDPEIDAGNAPVNWVNATVASSPTSRTPWCSSTVGSSMRIAAVAARPTVCRPGASVTHRSQAGPTTIATSTPPPISPSVSSAAWRVGRPCERAMVTLEPTCSPEPTRRSVGVTGRSSIASGVAAGRSSARARSATESVAACGRMTSRAPSGPIASHAGICSIPAQWAPSPPAGNPNPTPPHPTDERTDRIRRFRSSLSGL